MTTGTPLALERNNADPSDSVVALEGVSVSYGKNRVLNGVTTQFRAGEITALIGANGAGKSTLIKALSGAHAGYTGSIVIDGVPVHLDSPRTAQRLGISVVHQKISDSIVPGLSVADNIVLDSLSDKAQSFFYRDATVREKARAALEMLGVSFTDEVLRADAARLPISDAQLVLLARAIVSRPRLLILDEPSSALTAHEVERLFVVLRELVSTGIAVIYVSHRFGEIETLADRIIVLRDGLIRADSARPFDWVALVSEMLGSSFDVDGTENPVVRGDRVQAQLRQIQLFADSPACDLDVAAGEVLGIVGLIGAGKSELAELFVGAPRRGNGTIYLDGHPYEPRHPADAIRSRIAYVPEDRARQSILPGNSIVNHTSIPFLGPLSTAGFLRRRREVHRAKSTVEAFSVVSGGIQSSIDELSGGNAQKVIVGRWLIESPRVAILDEPFRGVDIAARREIGTHLRAVAAAGSAVMVLSSDVDEILELADRIIVLVHGEIALDTYRDEVDRAAIVTAFLGSTTESPSPDNTGDPS